MSEYERFVAPMDLCVVALEEAFWRVAPKAIAATLNVNSRYFNVARRVVREVHADSALNPLAPQINIKTDDSLENNEWFLEYGDKRVGSKGY